MEINPYKILSLIIGSFDFTNQIFGGILYIDVTSS